ncbi:uncharacterized protein [Littorina saxatilis]|uniref:uncharacterized protein isoform X2 n=1 Tax=Littorina saxatilis TaxID=31220 RepID=UPI0038B47097
MMGCCVHCFCPCRIYDDDETDLPTHVNLCCKSCTPQKSYPCRIIFFLIILGLDIADLFSDWLLYVDVSLAEEGLVYGPPEDAAIWALLAFSIVGSITFVFEGVNLWWEVFRNNPWLDTDLVSAVTIWIEDLPQIAINVYIAMCREDPISVFQLSKASIVLMGLMVRIVISLVKYCNKASLREARLKTKESSRHVAYRVFIMLGLLINSACAITVFIFTQTQRDMNGKVIFQVPTTVFEDKYNDQRYFQNVSVFIHHPDFDASTPNETTGYEANWVRFMTINDIRNQEDLDISYNYIYEKTTTHLKMALFTKQDKVGKKKQGKWRISECYQMEWATRNIDIVSNATCSGTTFFTSSAISVFITFSFTPPDHVFRKLIFGDIRFNSKFRESNGTCKEFANFTDSVGNNVNIPTIHYYRVNSTIATNNTAGHHMLIEGGRPRFYHNDGVDMEDITNVWKTGWGRCESSGSMAPHLEREIPTECSNILSHVG